MMNLALNLSEFPVRLRFEAPVTDEQLSAFSHENKFLRIEREPNGELTVMSPTGTEGGSTELNVGSALLIWARADGRGKTFGLNSGFTIADGSVRAADAAWTSWIRWNGLSRDEQRGYARLCSEFVIEIRSEGDRLKPLQEEMAMWTANGADLAWLIDPVRRVVEVYRPGEEVEVYEQPTSVQGTGPVAGFELVMQQTWG